MTRINSIPPQLLTNEHLMAEYRELPRVFTAVLRRLDKPTSDLPATYRLGTGHVKFFYDKCKWLLNRYKTIIAELEDNRGYSLDKDMYTKIIESVALIKRNLDYYNDWTPQPQDYYLSMARLARRSKLPTVLVEITSHD